MLSQNIVTCFALLVLLLITQTLAQCSNPTFFQCSAPNGAGNINYGDLNGFLGALDGAAGVSVDKLKLFRRQNFDGVCCNPSTKCLVAQGVPFCYSQQSTGFFFPNGVYGYTANNTLYAADGTLLYSGGGGQATSASVATAVASPTATTAGLTTKPTGGSGSGSGGQAGAQHAGRASAVSVDINTVILVAGFLVVWTIGLSSLFT